MGDNGHRDPLQLLTLQEISELIRRSRSALKADIAAGRLRAVHLGRSVRVPRMELERYLAEAGLDLTTLEKTG